MSMKRTNHASLVVAMVVLLIAVARLPAAVKVDTAQPMETVVAFRVPPNQYQFVTTAESNGLELAISRIGSKQVFTMIDLSGTAPKDGDEVRIRYVPRSGKTGTGGDITKASYWLENSTGVKRGRDGDVFKLKQVDTKFALLTASGKFVAPPTNEYAIVLGVATNQGGALLVDLIDVKTGSSIGKPADQDAKSGASAVAVPGQPGAASSPPTATSTPASSADKPAAQ